MPLKAWFRFDEFQVVLLNFEPLRVKHPYHKGVGSYSELVGDKTFVYRQCVV